MKNWVSVCLNHVMKYIYIYIYIYIGTVFSEAIVTLRNRVLTSTNFRSVITAGACYYEFC
jgi:hypothetical protein